MNVAVPPNFNYHAATREAVKAPFQDGFTFGLIACLVAALLLVAVLRKLQS